MAFKSGICSELNVPPKCFDNTRTFLKNTFREYGGSSYLVSRPDSAPAVSAIGMLCRQFVGGEYDADQFGFGESAQCVKSGVRLGVDPADPHLTFLLSEEIEHGHVH